MNKRQEAAVAVRGEQKRTERTKSETDALQDRISRLEALLDKLGSDRTETRIHIEHLHIQQAVLEQMTVKLEQLDIDEVSGSLNIGNNFHTTKGPLPGSGKNDTEETKETARETDPPVKVRQASGERRRAESGDSIRATPNGFTYRFDSRPGGGKEAKGGMSDGDS